MNWKYILIVVILAIFIAGGVLTYRYWLVPKEEVKAPEEKVEIEKESIQDVLAKAENIDSVQYEIVGTTTSNISHISEVPITETVSTKIWQKMPYMKIELTTAGTTTKTIVHPDAVYLYDASKDKYLKETAEEMVARYIQRSFEELSKKLRESETLKELGTETINGKLTTIVEYSDTAGKTPITLKLWIWNEKGIPLKTESTIEIGEMVATMKTEYKNFVFEDIPGSIFEVPEDKIIESVP